MGADVEPAPRRPAAGHRRHDRRTLTVGATTARRPSTETAAADQRPAPPALGPAPPPLTTGQRRVLIGCFLVLVALFAATAGGHPYSIDEEIMFQTTRSLVHLDPEVRVVDPAFPQLYHPGPDGGSVGIYGLGQSLAQLPLYLAGSGIARAVPADARDTVERTTTSLTNSVLTAITAVVLVLVARRWASFGRSLGLGAVFALGTYAWPHAKTSFAEPGTALCLLLAVAGVIAWHREGRVGPLAGAGAAAVGAVVFRASAVIFVPLLAVFVGAAAWRRDRGRGLASAAGWAAAGAMAPAVLLLATNAWRFDGPFDAGYPAFAQDHPIVRGIADQLFTPGKSVFLYAPVLAIAVVGAAAAQRRAPGWGWERGLLLGLVVANLAFFARVAFWAGDNAWGPRYVQIVLPLAVLLVAPLLEDVRWWRAVKVAGVVGAAGPALLGVLVCFNVLFVDASRELDAGVPVQAGVPTPSMHALSHDWSWQPLARTVALVPDAVSDIGRDDGRPPYSSDPHTHYGFFGGEPRIDVWWLWVGPTRGSRLTYLLWLPIGASALGGAALVRTGRRAQRSVAVRTVP
jgi:hypothetical protein